MQEMTECFSAEQYVTISGLLPCIHRLEKMLDGDATDTSEITAVKYAMDDELSDIFLGRYVVQTL